MKAIIDFFCTFSSFLCLFLHAYMELTSDTVYVNQYTLSTSAVWYIFLYVFHSLIDWHHMPHLYIINILYCIWNRRMDWSRFFFSVLIFVVCIFIALKKGKINNKTHLYMYYRRFASYIYQRENICIRITSFCFSSALHIHSLQFHNSQMYEFSWTFYSGIYLRLFWHSLFFILYTFVCYWIKAIFYWEYYKSFLE